MGAPRRGAPTSILGLLYRIGALAVIDAVALAFAYALNAGDLFVPAVGLLIVTALVNVIFLVDRLYPLRWLAPGVLLTILMVVYPLLFTVYISFTNYGGEHLLTKQQALSQIVRRPADDATRLTWTAYRNAGGEFLLWFVDEDGQALLGAPGGTLAPVDPADPRFGPPDPEDGLPATIDGYQKLPRLGTIRYLSELERSTITGPQGQVRIIELGVAEIAEPKYTYDPTRDVLIDNDTGVEYANVEGFFTAPDGSRVSPGFSEFVGPRNVFRVFTDRNIQGPFFGVFLWTFVFAGLSVALTFVVGLALALLFNDDRLPGRGVLRTLAIVPYTIPGFISALIWVGLLNPLYGPVNLTIDNLVGVSPEWFSDGTLAKVAILIVNTWLGYPYMMLIVLGALQAIPSDMYEAARIDGANSVQQFRRITFPLLLVAVAPLLIGAFAFNFNNFTLIDIVTQGGPPTPGAQTPAGQTDILISYTYRLAFSAGQGSDYGFASAVSIFIFLIVAGITIFNFRLSRRLEDMV